MQELQLLAQDIDDSPFQIKPVELMRWGHEDLLCGLKCAVAELELGEGIQIHCQVGFGSFLKQGPLYERFQHVRPDFVLIDRARLPIAFIDYLGAGHDAGYAAIKQAIASKTGMAFVRVEAEWTLSGLKQTLAQALFTKEKAPPMVQDAQALQEMLKRQNFGGEVARAA